MYFAECENSTLACPEEPMNGPLAIAWELPVQSSSFQDLSNCHLRRHARPFRPRPYLDLGPCTAACSQVLCNERGRTLFSGKACSGLWPLLGLLPWSLHGSFLSLIEHCTWRDTVHSESMFQPEALAWKLCLKTCSLQDLWHCS